MGTKHISNSRDDYALTRMQLTIDKSYHQNETVQNSVLNTEE